jgi:hypothetical protein
VKVSPNYGRLTENLWAWSELHVRVPPKSRSWDSARLLVQSAKVLDDYALEHLQQALADSNAELAPLGEPLKLNLGKHRWLSEDREESYSDWLAWILQGMSSGAEILPLFALGDEATGELVGPAGTVHREVRSQHGRTDIEVPFGKNGLLLIEVKVQNTGRELSSQLQRYAQKVVDQHIERPLLVLLGTEAPDTSISLFEFKFTDWRTLCQRLRRHAGRVKESDMLHAAAILIFCGAVEQNLLRLSSHPSGFHAMATINYLREWRCEV